MTRNAEIYLALLVGVLIALLIVGVAVYYAGEKQTSLQPIFVTMPPGSPCPSTNNTSTVVVHYNGDQISLWLSGLCSPGGGNLDGVAVNHLGSSYQFSIGGLGGPGPNFWVAPDNSVRITWVSTFLVRIQSGAT